MSRDNSANDLLKTVLALIVSAAICANCATLFLFGERLARIEAKLEALTNTTLANK